MPGTRQAFGGEESGVLAVQAPSTSKTTIRRDSQVSVLYAFHQKPDGATPLAGVYIDASGKILGTTEEGGTSNEGAVFVLAPASGGGYTESLAHSFNGNDGDGSIATPIEDTNGNIFVTTPAKGQFDYGTVVKLSPSSSGYQETAVFSFNLSNGANPFAALFEQGSTLYTTTRIGGKNDSGAIVGLSASTLSETSVYSISGNKHRPPWAPESDLVADSHGALYGTTYSGGAYRLGTVFKFTPGKQSGTFETLWTFTGGAKDGALPMAGVLLDSSGNIYGTTSAGGEGLACGGYQCGVIYKLSPKYPGSKKYVETILHHFTGAPDGVQPTAGLVAFGGLLYGTTSMGGTNTCDGNQCGTLFQISPTGSQYEVLHDFADTEGFFPQGRLAVNGSTLYGVTEGGPLPSDAGTVYSFVP